jgi:hypothetical protein
MCKKKKKKEKKRTKQAHTKDMHGTSRLLPQHSPPFPTVSKSGRTMGATGQD